MHTWLKTLRRVASPSSMSLVSGPAVVLLTIILLGSHALSQAESAGLEMSAVDLARKVVANELKVQDQDHGHWMYRLDKQESGRKQSLEILETNSGSLGQLLSLDGHPLDAKQQRKESERIQRLVSHPDEQRKLQQASKKKAEQGARLFRILPDVFVFSYAGRQGNLVTLTFTPNPNFQPLSLEARVFHSMEGEMTVDTKQARLAALHGHLIEDVRFGRGLIAHLDRGGNFELTQTEVAPGHWEITALKVDMRGRALIFKTIRAQEAESHGDFHRVADDLTLEEAAGILNRHVVLADNH